MHRVMIIGYLMMTIGVIVAIYNLVTFGGASPFGIPIIFVLSAVLSAAGLTFVFLKKEDHVETDHN